MTLVWAATVEDGCGWPLPCVSRQHFPHAWSDNALYDDLFGVRILCDNEYVSVFDGLAALFTFLFRLRSPFLVAVFHSSVRSENLTLELLASSTLLTEGVEGMSIRLVVGEAYRPAVEEQ